MIKLIPALLALLTCSCFYLLEGKIKYKTIIWVLYSLLFIFSCYLFIDKLIFRFANPQVWDFTSYYLWGKVASSGYNFYLPENSHLVFNSLSLPNLNYDTFIPDIVDIGFLYPPPAILYFAPLGLLSYKTALIVWTIFILFFMAASIKLVYEMFMKKYQLNGLILTISLFFIFSPVRSTIFYSQTNFILLYLLLLMKKYSNTKYAGIFLALAMFTKPYMVIFLLFFIINKKWNAIAYFMMTAFCLVGITTAIFGIGPIVSYIADNPVHRLPASVFFEDNNQSLHAILLRGNIISLNKPNTFFIIVAGLLGITATSLFYLKKKLPDNYIWEFSLLFALILYPGTLDYYGVLLLFILFQFFDNKQQLAFKTSLNMPIISIAFFLGSISVFTLFCFLLLLVFLKATASPALLNKLNPG